MKDRNPFRNLTKSEKAKLYGRPVEPNMPKTAKHTPETCDDCAPKWDRSCNYKTSILCDLHASAPDLLAALKSVARVLDGYVRESDGEAVRMLEAARAAIAKAEGGR